MKARKWTRWGMEPGNSEGLLIVLLLAVVVLMWVYRRANGGL
jgi:hypothetical protein